LADGDLMIETATKAVTVLAPPNEVEEDIAYCEGLLREWLSEQPAPVKEALETLAKGIGYYRGKVEEGLENFHELQTNYNALLVQSAQHISFMQQQRELLDSTLMDQQREYHKDSTDGFTR
jgi:hypothetical protein